MVLLPNSWNILALTTSKTLPTPKDFAPEENTIGEERED
jgi:hypothetical protein